MQPMQQQNGHRRVPTVLSVIAASVREEIGEIAQPMMAERGYHAQMTRREVAVFCESFTAIPLMSPPAQYTRFPQYNEAVSWYLSVYRGPGAADKAEQPSCITIDALYGLFDYAVAQIEKERVADTELHARLNDMFVSSVLKLAIGGTFAWLRRLLATIEQELSGAHARPELTPLAVLEQIPTAEERHLLATAYELPGALTISGLRTVVDRVQDQIKAAPGSAFPIRLLVERMETQARETLTGGEHHHHEGCDCQQ